MLREATQEQSIVKSVLPALFDPRVGALPEDPHHWYLMVAEAERAGLVGGPSDASMAENIGEQYETSIELQTYYAQFMNDPVQGPQIADRERGRTQTRIAARKTSLAKSGYTEQVIGNALAKAAGIQRLYSSYNIAGTVSKPEAIGLASRVHDVVIVQAGILGKEGVEEYITVPSEGGDARTFRAV